jgi:hypothetical protein
MIDIWRGFKGNLTLFYAEDHITNRRYISLLAAFNLVRKVSRLYQIKRAGRRASVKSSK